MKLSNGQKIRLYSHYDHEIDTDDDFWPIMGIFLTIWGLWTGLVHLIDWMTFDAVPWWAEPLTILPIIFLIAMKELYHSLNPTHWWPMVWGYTVRLPDDEKITIRPLDSEDIYIKYGGKVNVFIVDYEHIKFRRKKDAVFFGLSNSIS